jgi:hypothetical protein
MYLTLRNSDDGLIWHTYNTAEALLEMIAEETSEDLRPECRAKFRETPPTSHTSPYEIFIMKGEVAVPRPIKTVTEWMV